MSDTQYHLPLIGKNAEEFLQPIDQEQWKSLSIAEPEYSRIELSYKYDKERFSLSKPNFSNQYNGLYCRRLELMRPMIIETAQNRWLHSNPKNKELSIADRIRSIHPGKKTIIVGTIFKEMPLKPKVLEEYTKEGAIKAAPRGGYFVSDKDSLILEDETGRVRLIGTIRVDELVTGVVVALLGVGTEDGDFQVEEYTFSGFAPQTSLSTSDPSSIKQNRFIAFMSGISIGKAESNKLALMLAFDYLGGHIGSKEELQFISNINRLIIAGNTFTNLSEESTTLVKPDSLKAQQQFQVNHREQMINLLTDFDVQLASLCSTIDVDFMPGEYDPANFCLPQQPFNPCLFKQSYRYPTFHPVTNPYQFKIEDTLVLGTSGQPINNILQFVHMEDRLKLLETILEWRHLAPTAPDSLATFPLDTNDPFVIRECPHIFFAGNQPKFQQKIVQGPNGQKVLLLCLPKFNETGMIVIVNIDNLECTPIQFHNDIMQE